MRSRRPAWLSPKKLGHPVAGAPRAAHETIAVIRLNRKLCWPTTRSLILVTLGGLELELKELCDRDLEPLDADDQGDSCGCLSASAHIVNPPARSPTGSPAPSGPAPAAAAAVAQPMGAGRPEQRPHLPGGHHIAGVEPVDPGQPRAHPDPRGSPGRCSRTPTRDGPSRWHPRRRPAGSGSHTQTRRRACGCLSSHPPKPIQVTSRSAGGGTSRDGPLCCKWLGVRLGDASVYVTFGGTSGVRCLEVGVVESPQRRAGC